MIRPNVLHEFVAEDLARYLTDSPQTGIETRCLEVHDRGLCFFGSQGAPTEVEQFLLQRSPRGAKARLYVGESGFLIVEMSVGRTDLAMG